VSALGQPPVSCSEPATLKFCLRPKLKQLPHQLRDTRQSNPTLLSPFRSPVLDLQDRMVSYPDYASRNWPIAAAQACRLTGAASGFTTTCRRAFDPISEKDRAHRSSAIGLGDLTIAVEQRHKRHEFYPSHTAVAGDAIVPRNARPSLPAAAGTGPLRRHRASAFTEGYFLRATEVGSAMRRDWLAGGAVHQKFRSMK
jgi:hypothetical protein